TLRPAELPLQNARCNKLGKKGTVMSENSDAAPPLSRLTPDLAAEVRRNLIIWLSVGVTGAAVASGLFALAVDPGLSEVTGSVAVNIFVVFLTFLVPLAGLLLGLVSLFDCWPAMIRGRFLRERYGVAAGELDAAPSGSFQTVTPCQNRR